MSFRFPLSRSHKFALFLSVISAIPYILHSLVRYQITIEILLILLRNHDFFNSNFYNLQFFQDHLIFEFLPACLDFYAFSNCY